MQTQTLLAVTVIATAFLTNATLTAPATARDESPLSKLAGSWNGVGTLRFDGGESERLTCRGYYTIKNAGTEMGIALRCASAGAKIELRSQLTFQSGRISGTWEERTFTVPRAAP